VSGFSPPDSARSVPSPSTTGAHPGRVDTNRSARISRDTSSVTTQDPAGMTRWAAAIVAGVTNGRSCVSARTWK
jgi:hypothetical protein